MALRYFSCSGEALTLWQRGTSPAVVSCSVDCSNEAFILHVVPIYVKMYHDDAINILHL